MGILKKSIIYISSLIFLLFLFLIFYFGYHRLRNPLRAIEPHHIKIDKVLSNKYFFQLPGEKRKYNDVSCVLTSGDTLRFTVSLPGNYVGGRLPVVIILGGLEIGRESLNYIPYHGKNAVIAYEYPAHPIYWYSHFSVFSIEKIRKAVLSVPGQIYLLYKWSREQSWADTARINLLGYSFGAMFVPAVQRVIEREGWNIPNTVIAYGGVNIHELLKTNLYFLKFWQRTLLAYLISSLIHPLEPSLHIPYLKGNFLLINGKWDHQVPFKYARLLQEMMPEPRTIVNLNAGHMHPSKPHLTAQIIEISRQWLLKQGAINP